MSGIQTGTDEQIQKEITNSDRDGAREIRAGVTDQSCAVTFPFDFWFALKDPGLADSAPTRARLAPIARLYTSLVLPLVVLFSLVLCLFPVVWAPCRVSHVASCNRALFEVEDNLQFDKWVLFGKLGVFNSIFGSQLKELHFLA